MNSFRCRFSELAEDTFILTYDRMRKYQGEWHMEKWPLFSGCFFVEADQPIDCAGAVALNREDEGFLRTFFKGQRHLAISEGYIQSGRTYVTSGPLKGRETLIRKIDRHKRLARVELPGNGEKNAFCVGLEIVGKDEYRKEKDVL